MIAIYFKDVFLITKQLELTLTPSEQKSLQGEYNRHVKHLQERLPVSITQRGTTFTLTGKEPDVLCTIDVLNRLSELACQGEISGEELHLTIQSALSRQTDSPTKPPKPHFAPITLRTKKGNITPRGANQQDYVKKILISDVSFGVGPAGTGKTYLAVACAVDMLERGEIERILLVRPAVEAGEKLGFLPGDLTQKIDPYLRPLYDALYEMLGFEKVGKLLERQVIEVAPLAYMRGRTLNNSFVILDEAQNTTPEQMKMFLTRLGFGSRAVITGDTSQVDLPRGHKSGLAQALQILEPISEIHVTRFGSKDVVRHQLVQKIVEAYDAFDEKQALIKEQKRQNQDSETHPDGTAL